MFVLFGDVDLVWWFLLGDVDFGGLSFFHWFVLIGGCFW